MQAFASLFVIHFLLLAMISLYKIRNTKCPLLEGNILSLKHTTVIHAYIHTIYMCVYAHMYVMSYKLCVPSRVEKEVRHILSVQKHFGIGCLHVQF